MGKGCSSASDGRRGQASRFTPTGETNAGGSSLRWDHDLPFPNRNSSTGLLGTANKHSCRVRLKRNMCRVMSEPVPENGSK